MTIIRKGTAEVPKSGSGKFLSVKKGEDAVLLASMVGLDEMLSIDQHVIWMQEGNSPSFPCIGKENGCPGCATGDSPRFKGFLPVLLPTGEVKIWGFPISVERKLQELEEEVGSLAGKVLKVRAKPKGNFTEYVVIATGQKAKVTGVAMPDIEAELGPQDVEGILEMLEAAGVDMDGFESKAPTQPVKKAAQPNGTKPAPAAATKAKAVEPTKAIQPSFINEAGEEEETGESEEWA